MILGVAFLRNVYTVPSYETPNSDGQFSGVSGDIQPRIGLIGLTNIMQAPDDFHAVQVLNEPLGTNNTSSSDASSHSSKKFPVGLIALVAILGFLALAGGLFATRWWYMRWKYAAGDLSRAHGHDEKGGWLPSSRKMVPFQRQCRG
ncbi:MAG: hypothetical protein ACREHG_07870 [Candidatus Saccharimonadales bacterium]